MNDAFLYLKCHNKVLVHNDMAAPGLLLLQTDRQKWNLRILKMSSVRVNRCHTCVQAATVPSVRYYSYSSDHEVRPINDLVPTSRFYRLMVCSRVVQVLFDL
jgi:hypothetical protein